MFERYTERARRVVFFARYQASQFGSRIIETEHFLLGLMTEDKGVIERYSSFESEHVRRLIRDRVPAGENILTSIDLPLSNESKRILKLAGEEADNLGHRNIDTGHLLLGILRESGCVAEQVLWEIGIRLDAVRTAVKEVRPTPIGRPEGRFTTSQRSEDGTLVVESQQVVAGYKISTRECYRVSADGTKLIYSSEIVGPNPAQRDKFEREFDVGL